MRCMLYKLRKKASFSVWETEETACVEKSANATSSGRVMAIETRKGAFTSAKRCKQG